jgi:hypothetical protein
MPRKARHYVSGRMKRDFRRAILVGTVVAMGGFLLVHAALNPPKPKMAGGPIGPLPPATCNATLAAWKALSESVVRASAQVSDTGARCRLLSCPEVDCAALLDLRGTVASLAGTLNNLGAAPASLVAGHESVACGAVVSPLAARLAPGLGEARKVLDVCAERATCEALRGGHGADDDLVGPAALEAGAARIAADTKALQIAESPAPKIALDQTRYAGGDAIQARIDPARNRCLASGGMVGVFPDPGGGALPSSPSAPVSLAAGGAQSLLLEAPLHAGRYLVAVTGQRSAGPLNSAPFDVEAPRSGTCNGFAGRWETDRGVLTASVRHGVLRGTYRRGSALRPGFLIGQVKDRHFHGSWTSELGAGGAHLVLTRDGDRFVGTAGSHPGAEDGAGLWRGSCTPTKSGKITE